MFSLTPALASKKITVEDTEEFISYLPAKMNSKMKSIAEPKMINMLRYSISSFIDTPSVQRVETLLVFTAIRCIVYPTS